MGHYKFPSVCIDLLMSEKIENTRWKEGGEREGREKGAFISANVVILSLNIATLCVLTQDREEALGAEKGCDDEDMLEL